MVGLYSRAAGCRGQFCQITLARVQRRQAHPQVVDAKLVELNCRVRAAHQHGQLFFFSRSLDLGIADDVDRRLRL